LRQEPKKGLSGQLNTALKTNGQHQQATDGRIDGAREAKIGSKQAGNEPQQEEQDYRIDNITLTGKQRFFGEP
jgi:hypothetical protein